MFWPMPRSRGRNTAPRARNTKNHTAEAVGEPQANCGRAAEPMEGSDIKRECRVGGESTEYTSAKQESHMPAHAGVVTAHGQTLK